MSRRIFVAGFTQQEHLLTAVRAVKERRWDIVDVYCPYVVHGLDRALGWRRSRLPMACLLGGAMGVALALWFQFWATAWDWPLNVGGRPWNSLPAFVPVTFESMVLLAGFAVVFAWLFRSRLYPGKKALLPLERLTDDRFAVVVRDSGQADASAAVRHLLHDCHAVSLEEHDEEEPQ
jgi:hypothetical protein